MTEFYFDPKHDTNDGTEWTDSDIDDLRSEFECGGTVESAARFLCRSGTVEDVRKKARALGLLKDA